MFILLRCPRCETIRKAVEKVQYVRGQIYEKVRIHEDGSETIARREKEISDTHVIKTFYRCTECGLESDSLEFWKTSHTYTIPTIPEEFK